MTEVLRVGIAGYGTVGKIRLGCIDQHPAMRVVAVCDQSFIDPVVAPEGFRCWSGYHELLDESLDVLFVCLPNYLAPEVTIAGLTRGLHVFCEKPPGRDLADLVMVRKHEARHPTQKLMYGFNHRYHDSVRDAIRIIRNEELGRVVDLRGVYGKSKIIHFGDKRDWRTQRALAGGGILLDQGIHMVDMMRLFAGEFTEIHSYISNGYWNHDVEDNAYVLMRTAGGIVAMLHSSATQWRHRFQLDITLERGAIVLAGILSSTRSYGSETITVVYSGDGDGGDPKEQMTCYNEDRSWCDEVFDFTDAILADRPIVSGSSTEALKTMQLVYRIYCADPDWRLQFGLSDKVQEALLERG